MSASPSAAYLPVASGWTSFLIQYCQLSRSRYLMLCDNKVDVKQMMSLKDIKDTDFRFFFAFNSTFKVSKMSPVRIVNNR